MSIRDVIVIGCGGFGSAVLYHLAARGLNVLGIDQFAPPHDCGSSHGETRVIRKAYFEHPDYVPLLQRSWTLWEQLNLQTVHLRPDSERELFVRCGLLLAGPADGEVIPGVRRAAEEHSLAISSLNRTEAQSRFPGIRVPDGLEVVFEEDAGFLRAERCVEAHLHEALRCGAQLSVNEAVLRLIPAADSVTVHTSHNVYTAAVVVMTAGAWTSQLLPDYTTRIEVRRKLLFWYALDEAGGPHCHNAPIHLMETPNGQEFYGFPSIDGHTVKLAEHTGGQTVDDPSHVNRAVSSDESRSVDWYATQCLAGLQPVPVRSQVCMYSMSPDSHFLIDRLADAPLVVGAGFSGHGFKFTSVLGEALADLVEHGRTDLPIQFLSSTRLR